jgi:hypothetical protein
MTRVPPGSKPRLQETKPDFKNPNLDVKKLDNVTLPPIGVQKDNVKTKHPAKAKSTNKMLGSVPHSPPHDFGIKLPDDTLPAVEKKRTLSAVGKKRKARANNTLSKIMTKLPEL